MRDGRGMRGRRNASQRATGTINERMRGGWTGTLFVPLRLAVWSVVRWPCQVRGHGGMNAPGLSDGYFLTRGGPVLYLAQRPYVTCSPA